MLKHTTAIVEKYKKFSVKTLGFEKNQDILPILKKKPGHQDRPRKTRTCPEKPGRMVTLHTLENTSVHKIYLKYIFQLSMN